MVWNGKDFSQQPQASLTTPLPLNTAEVLLSRAQGSTGSSPLLSITHTCGQPPSPPNGDRYRLPWSQLDAFLQAAVGSSIMASLPEDLEVDWSALRLRLEYEDSNDTGSPVDILHIDARGSGPLFSIPIAKQGEGTWKLLYSAQDMLVDLTLTQNNNGLSVSINSGQIGMVSLDDAAILSLTSEQ